MLIAEIGNNHFGSLEKAKELIVAAKDSGADLVKSQAFGKDFIFKGSMPSEFYEEIKFTTDEYIYLIKFAKKIGIKLFYSVFYDNKWNLNAMNKVVEEAGLLKVSASQSNKFDKITAFNYDCKMNFISVPHFKRKGTYIYQFAKVMVATDYDWKPNHYHYAGFKEMLEHLKLLYGYNVGVSDHSRGISFLTHLLEDYTPVVIEKHFTLEKSMSFSNIIYRDTVHGSDPKEFKELSNIYKRS